MAAHGHPEGRVLDAGLVETYRSKFAKFLDLYEDTPQVRAVKCLDASEALGMPRKSRLRFCECFVEAKDPQTCKSKIFVK